ncbi:MAG: phosphoglucosamine mutase [Clostridiales bacterium]|nr:phosphoglucosamine mutase [Clostridiales bacterium]
MSKYFGTDGFRGEANVDLTVDHAFRIGRFLGHYFERDRECRVVIGKDTRLSSYMFENALTAGLAASGADVYLMHVTTTPSVSYVARTENFDCGIMISASHNPYHDNGIKLLNSNGEKMEDAVIEEIEKYLDGYLPEPPYATGERIGHVIDHAAGRNRYIGYIISLATHSYKGMRVGLDCANGSTWAIAKSVFDALGAETYVIANTPDGTNINNACGSTHIENLQRLVREKHLDVGFAFDGDADRCLAVDERGEVVNGDGIMYICGRHMKMKDSLPNNTVVTTVMSNFGLYKAFDACGISYEKTAVGDKYVYENMRQNGHVLGGEQSGHIIFGKYANTGDGLITAIKVMQVMIDRKLPLSALTEDLEIFPQVLKNVKVADKDGTLADPDVVAAVEKVTADLGDNGRILLRKSGTEPVLRVMVEAPTHELCEQKVDEVIDVMRQKGLLIAIK